LPSKYWNLFYKEKKDTFFKDRSWLMTEFPELREAIEENVSQTPFLYGKLMTLLTGATNRNRRTWLWTRKYLFPDPQGE
jgi:hypothetical protein